MAIVDRSEHQLVLQAGGGLSALTLTLDKRAGQARIERRTLMLKRKPRVLPLAEIMVFDVVSFTDRASGAVVRQLVLRLQSGENIPLPVAEREINETAAVLREFLAAAA